MLESLDLLVLVGMDTPYFDRLYDEVHQMGLYVELRPAIEALRPRDLCIVIRHPERGPLVVWKATGGSIESTARYAISSLKRLSDERN